MPPTVLSKQALSFCVKTQLQPFASTMKRTLIIAIATAFTCLGIYHFSAKAADTSGFQTYEFATIRWAGRENTHLIRPSGKVEMLGRLLNKVQRPDRTDERSFYMTVAMNAVAKEGFEFAGMTPDEIVMKRALAR